MSPADTLDTETLVAGTGGWTGVVDATKPSRIEANSLARLVNGRLDETGSVQLRPGTEWLAQPTADRVRHLAYFDTPEGEAVVAVTNGRLYELSTDRAPASCQRIAGITVSTAGPYASAQLVDKLILADGIRLLGLWREYGVWQSMQVSTFSSGALLPRIRLLLAHGFRLFICGGTGADAETVYGSDVLDPWTISNTVGVRVGRGEGDPIVALLPGACQQFFALKGGSCWVVDTTGAATAWTCQAISHQVGCWAGRTAVSVGQDCLFLSRKGVVQLSRLQADAPTAPLDLLSAPISGTMARINWSAARDTATACLLGELYLLSVPLDGSHRANAVLVYNTSTQKWLGEWTGWEPTAWCQSQFDGQRETLLGTYAGDLVRVTTERTTDERSTGRAEIALELETRGELFEEVDLLKQPQLLDVEFGGATATATLALRLDGGSPQALTGADPVDLTPEAGTASRRLILNLRDQPAGRELMLRLTTTGGAVGLREWGIKALPLRARWTPPPAALLVAPVAATDEQGSATQVRDASGAVYELQLVEIDTLTLPHDSLAPVYFREGLTVPAGSYVILYREGAFADHQEPEVADLPTPTGLIAAGRSEQIALTWDASGDDRVVGWTVYVAGVRTAEVAAPSYTFAVPGGGTRACTVYSRSADGTLSPSGAAVTATALPEISPEGLNLPGRSFDALSSYAVGEYDALNGGVSWDSRPASSTVYTYPVENIDTLGGYTVGEYDPLNGDTNWTQPAISTVYEYPVENIDALGSYTTGEYDALNGGTNWPQPASSTVYT